MKYSSNNTEINNSNDTNKKTSIAILGGTFDPIHNGHIFPANHVRTWLGIDHITLLPAHIPPHKKSTTANAYHRTNMVKKVCEHEQGFRCDARELNRSSHSYTVDSLNEIKAESPHSQLFFIIGMDSLQTFIQWHHWQEILTLCHLVVNTRPNYQINQLSAATQALVEKCHYENICTDNTSFTHTHAKTFANTLDKTAGYILFPPETDYDISSTQIRKIISKECKNTDKIDIKSPPLIPKYVMNYIHQHQLYQK